MQNQQLFNEKTSFSFSDLPRFYAVNEENFHSNPWATYAKHALQKLMQKTSFQATDATTQSLNQEENRKKKVKISQQVASRIRAWNAKAIKKTLIPKLS